MGLGLQSDKRPHEYAALAQRAEAAGFDVISVFHDLLFQPAIFPLLTIAAATERVRLGPAALNPSTLHPVELAGQAAALDLASGGRAYLGLVAGAWLDRLGLDERRPVERMREAVEVVRRLLAGERVTFEGRFARVEDAVLLPEPARRVPMMIGSTGDRVLRAALPHVDDFLSVRNLASLEALASHLEALPDRRGGRVRKTPDATSEEGRGGAQVAPWK